MRGRGGGTDDVFHGLRRRLTALFAVVAIVGLTTLTAILIALDSEFDHQRVDAILRGEASRAAALVYDKDEKPAVDGLTGDHVATSAQGLLVVHRTEGGYVTLFHKGMPLRGDWQSLAERCIDDQAEKGTFADVGDLRVAAMPWWLKTSDPAPSGCALALAPRRSALQAEGMGKTSISFQGWHLPSWRS